MKAVIVFFSILSPCICLAQLNPDVIAIPMRDGQSLAADLYLPSDQGQFPTILIQTPYNKNLFRLFLPLNVGQNISNSPYAFVIMDWRCFHASTAACVLGPSRGEDGYDAVEWIAAQEWCNGRVGTWGASALGNVQFNTAREKPPHLVCAVPIVSSPQTRYEQYYPGGVALPKYLETLGFLFGDAFDLIAQNPYYNLVWQITESASYYPDEINIPMLHVGGWFDHNTEDVLNWFKAIREVSPASDEQWLLMGPWTHGGTGLSSVGTSMQGELEFPEALNAHNDIANAFFQYYLLEEDNGWNMQSPVRFFQMGDNVWYDVHEFPSGKDHETIFYMTSARGLSPVLPQPATRFSLIYDPRDPSPTIGGKTLSPDLLQGPYDQSTEVESRDDNVIFTTAILTEDLVVQGQVRVNLFVSSDRPDTDIALRLTEVYPDGRSIAFGQIIQRMRFRSGFRMTDEEFMESGELYELEMTFDHLAHTFKAGNSIRLIITSSNYPWFNRNMNTGDEMYPNGNLDTLVNPLIAESTIHVQGAYPSRMILPVAGPSFVPVQSVIAPPAVFPNPADEYFEVRNVMEGSLLRLHDTAGRRIGTFVINATSMSIPTAHLPNGVYYVECSNGSRSSLTKVIIRH